MDIQKNGLISGMITQDFKTNVVPVSYAATSLEHPHHIKVHLLVHNYFCSYILHHKSTKVNSYNKVTN